MAKPVVLQAVIGGVLLAAACVPHLLGQRQAHGLLLLRLALLFPLVILLFQIMLAWTRLADGCEAFPRSRPPWVWLEYAGLAAALAAVYGGVVDPRLAALQPGYYPAGLTEWLAGLPWVAGFQPLVLVAAVFAFAVRLSGSTVAATAAVAVIRQAAVLYHWHSLPALPLFLLVLLAGIHGVFVAVAYRRLGYPGAALVALILEARFLLGACRT